MPLVRKRFGAAAFPLLLPRAGALATVLALGTAGAVTPTAAHAQPDAADASTTAMARARFKEGVAYYDKGNFEKARASFLQAYALKRHPLVLINVALSCLKSDHALEAARDFRQFLAEAKDITEQQRSDATDGLKQSLARIGQIEVSSDRGAEVTLDAEQAGTTPLGDTLLVEAGAHAVRVRAPDGTEDTRRVVVAAGEKVAATFVLARAPVAPPPSPVPQPLAPSVATAQPPPVPAEAPPPAASAPPSTAATEPETKAAPPLPNEPPSEVPPSTLPLWPSYVGYALAAPAIAAALYVGFKSESDAQTNANVTRSNILQAGGSCPNTSPAFSASCAQYSSDLNLVTTDKTIGYVLAASGGTLFAASTVWLIVGFVHNSQSPTVPAGSQTGFFVAPLLGPMGTGLAVFSKF